MWLTETQSPLSVCKVHQVSARPDQTQLLVEFNRHHDQQIKVSQAICHSASMLCVAISSPREKDQISFEAIDSRIVVQYKCCA